MKRDPPSRQLSRLLAAAIPLAAGLGLFGVASLADAVCTAANPNASMAEATPNSAFTINANGTVTHNLTGLMWKRCVQGLSGAACTTGSAATLTWSAALAAAVADQTGGHKDWRVPTRMELESIIESCGWGPAINQTAFPATPAQLHFTSTTYLPGPSRAAGIHFIDGSPFILDKTFPFHVRLVRGGRTFDAFDAQPALVTVNKLGTGSGSIGSSPGGIACGGSCSAPFSASGPVVLTATAEPGSVFTGWLGACTGTGQCTLNVKGATSVSATFAPGNTLPRADIDANNQYRPLTDGLLIIRYLFGLTDAPLTAQAIGSGAARSAPPDIFTYLDDMRPLLDADGNGQVGALTDGLLFIRYLFGLRGAPLTQGALGVGATRTQPAQIETYIQSVMP